MHDKPIPGVTTVQYCIMANPSPVYLFKHVKHGTQNIQNDCHKWLSDSFGVHQIRFWPGLLGELTAPLRLPSWFKGTYFQGEGDERRGRNGREEEGKRSDPLSQIPGSVSGGKPILEGAIDWTAMQKDGILPNTIDFT